jgi:hypothetical protein
VALLGAAILIGASGCALLPGLPFWPLYFANRDGFFLVGIRCSPSLAQVSVFEKERASSRDGSPVSFDDALWRAVSEPPLAREFELWATGQPGVEVITASAAPPQDAQLYVFLQDSGGRWIDGRVTLGDIGDGLVVGGRGLEPWAGYWRWPDWDYGGCGA